MKKDDSKEVYILKKELSFQNEEKENRAAELLIANVELAFQKIEKENRAAELLIANIELAFQNEEKEKRAAELVIANKELAFQNIEKESRSAELAIANKELAFQNVEREKRAAELLVANKELTYQNIEKEKRAAELVIANEELAFENLEKESRAAELAIANKELAFQNAEKESRAAELVIANKELAFQNVEKERRAAELMIANKELAYQYLEKEKRATELAIANKDLAFQNTEKEKRIANSVSLTRKLRLKQLKLIKANAQLRAKSVLLTEQEEKLKNLDQAKTKLRMAVNAANMGTYSIDSTTLVISASARFQEMFGFRLNEPLFFKTYFSRIRADYRQIVFNKMKAAFKRSEHFDMEYPVIRFDNEQVRWLKVIGGLQNNNINAVNKIFTGAVMDITEQKHDEQRKDDFINIVSHELKTPLTSLNGYIQILRGKARKAEDPFAIVILDKTVILTKKMTTMINGFLNVSRLEPGKIHIDKQRFNLANLLKEIQAETHNMISSHHIVFESTKDIYVHADRDKIDQVVQNLISNAVKYSPATTQITVSWSIVKDTVCVSVKDNGMGVAMEDIKRLFDRYYRVERQQMHTISGFGIGLYLCAEIIQRHEGKIWVESKVNKGSTFYFSLPLHSD
jgi:signal transduction histidine kinase